MRLQALRAGVEGQAVEARRARLLLQIAEQRPTDAARAASLVGDEIVHVELFPVKRVLVHSVDRHTRDVCAIGRHAHARAAGENALHFRFIFGRQRGTQLTVHGFGLLEPAGRRNYARSIGDLDDPHHSNPSLRNISRIPRMACRVRASFSINAILT